MQEWYYGWGGRPKKMTKRQIQEMLNNMRKSDIVNKKSKQYHEKEEIEAEEIIKKLDENL